MTTRQHEPSSEDAPSEPHAAAPEGANRLRVFGRWAATFFCAAVIVLTAVWGALALFYLGPQSETLRSILAGCFAAFGVVSAGLAFSRRWRMRAVLAYLGLFGAVVIWYGMVRPSNERAWQPEVAVLPSATIDGDLITVRNIRNFDYRTPTDYDIAYYDRTFDLQTLDSADLIASYWMGPAIAHIFVSFGFSGGEQLAVSIETRKEKGEAYSSLKGFFKQYELFYVVADERDVIRLRTNYRDNPPEDVYLFPLDIPRENIRRIFVDYVRRINSLVESPEFYNTLTTNCTSSIWLSSKVNSEHLPYSWKVLLSGHAPEYLYEHGRIKGDVTFEKLMDESRINDAAHAADKAGDFSRRIRSHGR